MSENIPRGYNTEYGPLGVGEKRVCPPVRCPVCRGMLNVVPCRLCRSRHAEKIFKKMKQEEARRVSY